MTAVDNLKLEVAFASSPDAAAPTWTDITAYWRLAATTQITRGRQDEQGDISPGVLSLSLDNTDGRFTSGSIGSPYYPNVKIRKQIRITYRENTSTRTNYCTNPQPTTTTGWAGVAGGTVTTAPWDATRTAFRAQGTGAATAFVFTEDGGAFLLGDIVTVSAMIQVPAGKYYKAHVHVRTGNKYYGTTGVGLTLSDGNPVRVSATATLTAADPDVELGLLVYDSAAAAVLAAGVQFYVGDALVEKSSSAGDYFDGGTADGSGGYDYAWTGSANASSSTATPITYPVFHGHVDEWPTEWPTGDDTYTEATVSASDRTKRLGSMLPLRGVPQEAILADGPNFYFPLTEPSAAAAASDLVAGVTLSPVQVGSGGAVNFGGGTGPSTDSSSSVAFEPVDASNGKYLQGTRAAGFNPLTTQFDFEFAFATTTVSTTLLTLWDAAGVANIKAVTDASGYLSVTATDPSGLGFSGGSLDGSNGFSKVNDGQVHHVGVTFRNNGGFYVEGTVYLDGVATISAWILTFPVTSGLPFWTTLQVAGSDSPSPFDTAQLVGTASVSHLALGTFNHSAAILTGFAGESSNARIARVAGWVGMGSFLTLDTGASTSISHIDATGRTALDVMKDVASTENGQLFGSRDGKIAFHSRTRRLNAATAVTLSTTNQDIGEGLRFRTNDQFLVNDVTATSPVAGTTRAADSTSITDFGYARDQFDIYTTDANEAHGAAYWRLNSRRTPLPRAEGLQVDLLASSSATRVAVVQLDVSSRVALAALPATSAAATADLFVEGYSETISSSEWTRTFNTSPGALGKVWALGIAGLSELAVTTVPSY